MGVDFNGQYESLPCTDNNKNAVQTALSAKLDDIECVKSASCAASVAFKACGTSRKKRAADGGMTMTVSIVADVPSGSDFDVADLMQNKSSMKIISYTNYMIYFVFAYLCNFSLHFLEKF